MSSQIERLIEVARAEIGYLEKKSNAQLDDKKANAGSGNYTKYWRDMYPTWQGQAWCAAFISWCARQAGISENIIPTFYSCSAGAKWFETRKRWHTYADTPQAGDIIFFGIPAVQHVELVTDVRGGRVYTIGGNTSGGTTMIENGGEVCEKSYMRAYPKIHGYGRPKYEEDEMTQGEFEKMYKVMMDKQAALAVNPGLAADEYAESVRLGISDGSRPQTLATRQEVAVMAMRAAKKI